MLRFSVSLLIVIYATTPLFSQLDSVHWLPPMYARGELGPQYLYLSTPVAIPFTVNITTADGNPIGSVSISNSQPGRFFLGSDNTSPIMVAAGQLHAPVFGKGIKLLAEKKFFANFRYHSDSEFQAADLTCKGASALGRVFRLGHLFQAVNASNNRSNFIGLTAVEDSTLVELSDFDTETDLQINGVLTPITSPLTLTLQAGQSLVFGQHLTNNAVTQPPNGLIGALLQSNKPVAVNVGSWTGSPLGDNSADVGLDQIVPFDKVGKEYILCKGAGSSILETPIIVAHLPNTSVWINGETAPATVLNAGEFFKIGTDRYSTAGNMYIQTSESVYLYQVIGGVPSGDNQQRTAGLMFVPPISCAIPSTVDNIFEPNQIGSKAYDGGLMITAMRDSVVSVRINGALISLGAPDAVPGNPDFVTYRQLGLFSSSQIENTASVVADGAVQVALYGRNGAAGFGAFYSGFTKTEQASLAVEVVGDGVCPDTLLARGNFDGVQWFYNDSLLTFGPDTFFVAYAPGEYIVQAYLGICRRNELAIDTLEIQLFNSPQFPYAILPPTCYGEASGAVLFGQPTGGKPPYSYSVDNGAHFYSDSTFDRLRAGAYQLVARDSTGCYNRPLQIEITQPDSLTVDLYAVQLPDPLKPGETVILSAAPNREVVQSIWTPGGDTLDCVVELCLRFWTQPEDSGWYAVEVLDQNGCPATDRIYIDVMPRIYAPNAIMPASEMGNERFYLSSKADLPILWLRIFDRWGDMIFETRDVSTNDRYAGWDGWARGKELTPGVFVFQALIEWSPGKTLYLTGDITLVR